MINCWSFQKFKVLEICEFNYLNTVGGDYFLLGKLKHGFLKHQQVQANQWCEFSNFQDSFTSQLFILSKKIITQNNFFKKNLKNMHSV